MEKPRLCTIQGQICYSCNGSCIIEEKGREVSKNLNVETEAASVLANEKQLTDEQKRDLVPLIAQRAIEITKERLG